VAFFTWQGDLLLMKPDGQTQLIASQVGLGRSDFTRLLAWSPDGGYLYVSDRGTAWVVTLPGN
jgi:DNA-binding beta-propeller fold protein YncE